MWHDTYRQMERQEQEQEQGTTVMKKGMMLLMATKAVLNTDTNHYDEERFKRAGDLHQSPYSQHIIMSARGFAQANP